MRPTHLTLQAFGSYGERTEISFERTNQNLFLITGDTELENRRIFDAIVFALYGEAGSTANKKDIGWHCKASMSTMRRNHLWSWCTLKWQ